MALQYFTHSHADMRAHKSVRGFSLVELSVVLVILALIVGGIMVGQGMVQSAKLRKLVKNYEQVYSAQQIFQEKFDAIPGDMTNATEFWGVDPDGCMHHTNRIPKKETCDGNGDGVIGVGSSFIGERFRLWQHLAGAGLVKGIYTGVAGSDGIEQMIPGENIMLAYDDIGIGLMHFTNPPLEYFFDLYYGNSAIFGGQKGEYDNSGRFLTTSEARAFDLKIDDGMPAQGSVIGFNNELCTNAVGDDTTRSLDYDAEYDLTREDIVCAIFIRDIF